MEAFQSLCQIGSSINQETAVKAHRRTERRGELLVKTTNSRDCRGVGFRLLNPGLLGRPGEDFALVT